MPADSPLNLRGPRGTHHPEPDAGRPRVASGAAVDPAEPSGDAAAAHRPQSHWLSFVLVAGGIVLLDQITKRLIDANLPLGDSWPNEAWPARLMHVKNTGAAFSMLQNQTLFLTLMSLVGLGAILLYFRFRPSDHPLLRFALALQLGGAIGNLIDRARYGEVTDFLKVPHWPVFNIADSAISIGVVTVVCFLLFAGGEGARRSAPER